jgi:hypothetical protein
MPIGFIIVTHASSPPIAKLPRNEIESELLTSECDHTRNEPGDEPDPLLHESNRDILSRPENAIEAHLSLKV